MRAMLLIMVPHISPLSVTAITIFNGSGNLTCNVSPGFSVGIVIILGDARVVMKLKLQLSDAAVTGICESLKKGGMPAIVVFA